MIRFRSLARLAALSAVLAMVAAACGSSGSTASGTTSSTAGGSGGSSTTAAGGATTTAASGKVFRIAVVAPSAKNDVAFTQSIFDALDRIAKTRKIQVDSSDNLFVVEDAANAIRGYADKGYDLVIAHGSQYGAPLQEIAPKYPKVAFAWGTAADTFGLANVSSYSVASDEGGYVMGTIAAQLTKSNKIGIVGPIEVGDAKLYVDGFKAGAKTQNPSVDATANYIQSFSDVNLAQEAATAFVKNGADVLTGTAQMVVGATGVAKAGKIPWFGTQSNQTQLGPDIVVASQVYHWEVALNALIDSIQAGTLGGKTYTANLQNGGLVIEYNAGYTLDPAIKAKADQTAASIKGGSLKTGVS